jgi:hypothetical protein
MLNIGWKTNLYVTKKQDFNVDVLSISQRPQGGFVGRWVSTGSKVLNVPEIYRNYSSFETQLTYHHAVRHSMIRGGISPTRNSYPAWFPKTK